MAMIVKTDLALSVSLIWCTLVAAPLLAVLFFFSGSEKSRIRYKLPPGPPTLPIIGNMHQFVESRNNLLEMTGNLARIYGPVFLMKFGVKHFVFVSNPELVNDILKTQDNLFAYRPSTEDLGAKRYLFYGDHHITLGQQGEYHNFYRKLIFTELLGQKKLKSFRTLRMEEQALIIREAFEAWSSKPNTPINVHNLFNTLVLNIITRMVVGRKFFGLQSEEQDKCEDWKAVINDTNVLFKSFLVEDAIPSLKWVDTLTGARRRMQLCHSQMDCLMQRILDDHKKHLDDLGTKGLAEMEPKDFMELVLLLSKRENVKHVTDESIKAVGVDLIFAATVTSSDVLEWALSELIANPDEMRKAQEEVDSVVGKGRCVHETDVPQLPFVAAIVKETLRLHPVVPWLLPRSCRVDCKVGGYDIPKESVINIDLFTMSHNPAFWKNPLKFDPNRFLAGDGVGIDTKGMHSKLVPFGAGRRTCLGMAMGNNTVLSTLARLVHSFDWSLPDGHQLDMSYVFSGALFKKTKLEVKLTPRLPLQLYNT